MDLSLGGVCGVQGHRVIVGLGPVGIDEESSLEVAH